MVCTEHKIKFQKALRSSRLRATPARLAILDVFAHQSKPISIRELKSKLFDQTDIVTLYRNAEALAKMGILNRIRLQDKKDYYEFAGKTHHHHLVCATCGKVVDVTTCEVKPVSSKILKSNGFASFSGHSLEFFGLCQMCFKN